MRIWSLLPSATEILFALGLGEQVTGVTHECDYPPEVEGKPRVTFSFIDSRQPSAEIDRQVGERLYQGLPLYGIDEAHLRAAPPDLIVTQDLCPVCAVSPSDLASHLEGAGCSARVVCLNPNFLDDVLMDIRLLGEVTGREAEATAFADSLWGRIERVAAAVAAVRRRPRLLCLEWLGPLMPAGHWVPQMVALAGGDEGGIVAPGRPARKMPWEELRPYQPEVIVLMPCGCAPGRATQEALALWSLPGWRDLPAVSQGQLFAVDANAYFSRPGPRLVDGLEILARILHPALFTQPAPAGAVLKLAQVPDDGAPRFFPYR